MFKIWKLNCLNEGPKFERSKFMNVALFSTDKAWTFNCPNKNLN